MLGRRVKWIMVFEDERELSSRFGTSDVFVHRSMFGELLFVRCNEEFHAFRNKCPHQNKPLDNCWIEEGNIVCPFHRYAFSCTDGRGQGMYIDKYQLKIEDGHVFIGKEGWSLF